MTFRDLKRNVADIYISIYQGRRARHSVTVVRRIMAQRGVTRLRNYIERDRHLARWPMWALRQMNRLIREYLDGRELNRIYNIGLQDPTGFVRGDWLR